MVDYPSRGKRVLGLALVASLAAVSLAHAQSAIGLTRAQQQQQAEQQQTAADSVRDANNPSGATDGVTEAGEDQSGFTHDGADGAFDTASGVGASGAANAFDNLTVVTQSAPAPGAKATQSTSGGADADPTLSGNNKQ